MRLVRKTSFCFFLQKKNHKKKGQKRDILRPNNVFSTPNTARRTTNQKTTTGQKRERTTTFQTRIIERAADSFENPSLDAGRHPTTRVVVSRLFFVGEIFQFRIGSRVKSKKEEQRGERRRDGQRSSRASTREGALRFPVFFCDSSSARIEEDDRRCRASDRRGTFLKCHAKMCSVINQSVPPNDIQKRRDGCTTNLRDARVLRSSESSSTRRARTTWTSTITFFPSLTITFGRV